MISVYQGEGELVSGNIVHVEYCGKVWSVE
jgi:hypothetical protein